MIGRQQQITLNTNGNPSTCQALLWLPDDYNNTNNQYPLIISLPGTGEQGSDINLLLNSGQLARRISDGLNPQTTTGLKYIVCTPQGPPDTWGWNIPHISAFIDQLLITYRVNPDMIYLSGLSAGSWGIQSAFQDVNIAKKVSAVCLISSGSTVDSGCTNIAITKTPTWIICGTADAHFVDATNEKNTMINNGYTPLFTGIPNVDHSAWYQAYDPAWSDIASGGMNLYDWLATNVKGGIVIVPPPPDTTVVSLQNDFITKIAIFNRADGSTSVYSNIDRVVSNTTTKKWIVYFNNGSKSIQVK